ncbi:DUF397 domain-containing protein [Kitasatospora sp. NPDC059811]|uniref:DUF397 domain-containing protein n=1 Tax=unclassified Kitasatospora TaxID=2633591 RepID=UPI00365E3DAD
MQPHGKPEKFVKSSYSNGQGGECVEWDVNHPARVRDSKDPDGPRLNFSPEGWSSFVAAVKEGTFGDV